MQIQYEKLANIVIISFCLIYTYGNFLEKYEIPDILQKKFANCQGCDGWGLSHVILYIILGYLFPDKHFLFMLLSVIWEFVETYLGIHLKSFKNKNKSDDAWWYGRVSDIACNLVGYTIGDYFSRKLYLN